MTPPPVDWLNRLPELAGPVALEVAGYATPVMLTVEALERAYLPMLALLDEKGSSGRVLAGLAGIPGSGKSTFVAAMSHVADRLLGGGSFVAVGIDGWHLRNTILDQRTTRNEQGRPIPLRQRKGGPDSFDVPAIAAAIEQLKGPGRTIRLPVYDRRLHDPWPDGLTISSQTRIVLIEGNYLLNDTPPWSAVSALLSPKFLLACDPASARQRVIARHVRGGCTPDEAQRKYDQNDGLNADIVLRHADRADWIVELEPAPSFCPSGPARPGVSVPRKRGKTAENR